jgi:hypothetical protein
MMARKPQAIVVVPAHWVSGIRPHILPGPPACTPCYPPPHLNILHAPLTTTLFLPPHPAGGGRAHDRYPPVPTDALQLAGSTVLWVP